MDNDDQTYGQDPEDTAEDIIASMRNVRNVEMVAEMPTVCVDPMHRTFHTHKPVVMRVAVFTLN